MSNISAPPPLSGVDRALSVLQELADAGPQGLSLGELAARLGQNKATVHRALGALRHRGFAAQEPTGRYVMGAAALALSARYFSDQNLAVLVAPALTQLSATTDELVHLGVLAGLEVVYLDKVEPARAVRVWSQVGSHSPAATTALGRAILAYRLAPGGEDAFAQASGLDADGAARLRAATAAARAVGYAQEVEENEPGIACVAVPLLRDDSPVAAVSITAPADRMTAERRAELGRELLSTLPRLLPAPLHCPTPHPMPPAGPAS